MFERIVRNYKHYLQKYHNFLDKHCEWYMDHARERKLIIFGTVVTMMIALLIGTRFIPEKSKFPDTPIGTGLSFGKNSTATISMNYRKYNESQKFMIIKFTVKAENNRPIDPRYVSFKAVTLKGQNTKYQVLPLANNEYVVILSNLDKGYTAIQIKATNKQPDVQTSALDESAALDVSDSSSSASSESVKNDPITKDGVKFVINEDNKFIDNKMPKLNQVDYAVQSLQKSISKLNGRIDQQYKNIDSYQKQIIADKNAIKAAQKDRQYQVDKTDSDNQIANAQADIKLQQDSIKAARKIITTIQKQIDLYRKQINDIESGKYKFKKPISADSLK